MIKFFFHRRCYKGCPGIESGHYQWESGDQLTTWDMAWHTHTHTHTFKLAEVRVQLWAMPSGIFFCEKVAIGQVALLHLYLYYSPNAPLFFFVTHHPPVGQGLLIVEALRSNSDTPHAVWLLWTEDQPDAETSTWQHTTLTTDKHPRLQHDSNPQP